MKKHVLTFMVVAFSLQFNFAQNLVPNPDFEKFEKCPQHYTRWIKSNRYYHLIPDWNYPTAGTPDYFNRCADNPECSVPENENGTSEPFSGDAYAGFFLMGRSTKNYREYLDCKLIEPLEKGKTYCVSLRYKLSTMSYYAVDNLGILFLGMQVHKNNEEMLTNEPQIANPKKEFMTNKSEWKELTQIYTAKGNEYYMIIGNFDESLDGYVIADTTMIPERIRKYPQYRTAYYYIDMVSVKLLTKCEECNAVPHDFAVKVEKAKFTGGSSGEEKDGEIELSMSGGTKPYNLEWANGMKGTSLKNLAPGVYKYKAKDKYNCIVEDEVVFSGPLKVFAESDYKGENTGWIKLTPKGGVPPYRIKWEHGQETKNVDGLSEGTYTYTVTDKKGDSVTGNETFDAFAGQLNNIEEGGKIVLENIFFDTNKTNLLPKSFVELDKVIDFMHKTNVKLVEISGHTDSKGSDTHNQKLSEGRSRSVFDYLITRGIEKERLAYVGYGEAQPIATNDTDDGRQLNRRVEFKILKK